MKKIQFNHKNLESLKSNELQGISSVIGGAKYPSQWSYGSMSGTDSVYWGSGECGEHALQTSSGMIIYVDIDFHSSIPPRNGRLTVAFDKFVGYM